MIPKRIKKENVSVRNFEELEYKYLVELPQELIDKYEGRYPEDNKKWEFWTDNGFKIYRFLGVVGDSNLFFGENRLYTASLDKDFIYMEDGCSNDNWAFLLNDELLKNMVNKHWSINYKDYSYITEIFEKYENTELDVGDLIQRVLAYNIKRENKQKKEQEKAKLKREEEMEGTEEVKEVFDTGEWKENDSVYGSGNVLYSYKNEYTFKKDINKLFTIADLNNACNGYNRHGTERLNWIEALAVQHKASYTFIKANQKRSYVVKFKKDKMYVDNVCVPIARASFFISRADGDSEKLKILKELSAVKVEFLGLTNITLHTDSYIYSNVPIEIKYVDKLWEVTLFDKTIKEDWKDLDLFRHNIQRLKDRFYTNDIPSLMRKFEISKADLFNFMKKTQLLDKLGEED